MIVLDTSVLVYAVGTDHPLREPARHIIRAVQAGTTQAQTTAFVIQEFLHVAARRRDRTDAARLALEFSLLLAPMLAHEEASVASALELYTQYKRLGAFDAFLAATVHAAGASLVSADRAFAAVDGLSFVDLGGAELPALLGP